MPISYRYESEINAIVLTVSGVVTAPERMIMIRVAEFLQAEVAIRKVLLDLSGVSKDGDVDEAFGFAKRIEENAEIFRGLRMAVVPTRDFFFISSVAVLALQRSGIEVVECQTEKEARAWLAESAIEAKAENAA